MSGIEEKPFTDDFLICEACALSERGVWIIVRKDWDYLIRPIKSRYIMGYVNPDTREWARVNIAGDKYTSSVEIGEFFEEIGWFVCNGERHAVSSRNTKFHHILGYMIEHWAERKFQG